jgi:drug/metabolite transporter (DMT)-like permease
MFAAGFGYLLLDETLTPVQLLGAAVTLAGITLSQSKGDEDSSRGNEQPSQ